MGLELAEQLDWNVPDVIFYPTGGGTGLIGMWKAFAELEAIGFIGKKRPRMVAVQAAGCAPMVKAFEEGEEHAPRWENAHTIASGIRVPQAIGDFLILRAVRESGGFAIAVEDDAIQAALDEMAREEGFLLCPEGAATYAAYKQSLGRRPRQEDRPGGAVQLRQRPEISAAEDRAQARPPQADRLRGAVKRGPALIPLAALSHTVHRRQRRAVGLTLRPIADELGWGRIDLASPSRCSSSCRRPRCLSPAVSPTAPARGWCSAAGAANQRRRHRTDQRDAGALAAHVLYGLVFHRRHGGVAIPVRVGVSRLPGGAPVRRCAVVSRGSGQP